MIGANPHAIRRLQVITVVVGTMGGLLLMLGLSSANIHLARVGGGIFLAALIAIFALGFLASLCEDGDSKSDRFEAVEDSQERDGSALAAGDEGGGGASGREQVR